MSISPLRLPLIVAPMFLISSPKLVVSSCRAGVVGTFPALNQRTTEGYEEWLREIKSGLQRPGERAPAPYGVNLIVHRTNPRLHADLEVTVKHQVPLVITSLVRAGDVFLSGAVSDVVDAVHSYGGLVYHDIVSIRHAEKAVEAGVDGLIAVCAGAGGHAGTTSPFALVSELRSKFENKTIILAGCISSGQHVAAAVAMGADYAYSGTRFIATKESEAEQTYKDMICAAHSKDIIYTPAISGIPANFLRPSIERAGFDPDNLKEKTTIDLGAELSEGKAWRDIWSAGQGVGSIDRVLGTEDLVDLMEREYRQAVERLHSRM